MSNKLQLRVFICSLLFFIASMSAMLVYAQNKAVVIDDVEGQIRIEEDPVTSQKVIVKNLNIQKDSDGGSFEIPLPQGVTAEQVSIENKYILQELWVSIEGCESTFFDGRWIAGDTSTILSGTYEIREDRVVLKLLLSDIYECKNLMENGRLLVEPVNPHTLYNQIVVIDPLDGDWQWNIGKTSICENDISLDIAKKLQTLLAESGIKAYFTRLENVERSQQLRQHLVDTLKPDFMVSIGVSQEEIASSDDATKDAEGMENGETEVQWNDGENYGVECFYNTYFMPEISGVTLADTLVREVTMRVNGRGNGVWEGTDASQLYLGVSVPAVKLSVGYLSNEKERELLARENYRDKITEGIYAAIVKMFEGEDADAQ